MAYAGTVTNYFDKFRNPYRTYVWEVSVTVAASATTAQYDSPVPFGGRVVKVEIDPGTLAASATIKAYEKNTALATGTRDHFLDYTVPNPAVEVVIYPHVAGHLNTGAAASPTISVPRIINDYIRVDVADAVAANTCTLRFYIEA